MTTLGVDRRHSLAAPVLGAAAVALAAPAVALGTSELAAAAALGALAAAAAVLTARRGTVRGQAARGPSAEQARLVSAGGRGGGRGRSPLERTRHVSGRGSTSTPLPCASAPLPNASKI